jgi:SAM-dependent methyltransferase
MTNRPRAYEAYQRLADHYAAGVDTKPHNAYYERPAMVAMWPDLRGKRVLDAGCGPGVYAELLRARGAEVIAVDASDRMLQRARERLGSAADLRQIDLSQGLAMFADNSFDFINAPLCLDYIEDWRSLFREFHRVLGNGGRLQFSCGHPAFDAEYFRTERYFEVEAVSCVWKGFGIDVEMPSYRRSMSEALMPLAETGFRIAKIVEPLPTDDFRRADPVRFATLCRRPAFLCVQAERMQT